MADPADAESAGRSGRRGVGHSHLDRRSHTDGPLRCGGGDVGYADGPGVEGAFLAQVVLQLNLVAHISLGQRRVEGHQHADFSLIAGRVAPVVVLVDGGFLIAVARQDSHLGYRIRGLPLHVDAQHVVQADGGLAGDFGPGAGGGVGSDQQSGERVQGGCQQWGNAHDDSFLERA